jgi:hypothetical protein
MASEKRAESPRGVYELMRAGACKRSLCTAWSIVDRPQALLCWERRIAASLMVLLVMKEGARRGCVDYRSAATMFHVKRACCEAFRWALALGTCSPGENAT